MKPYSRNMKKGCPQVSIIGSVAWVWTMDAVLNYLKRSVPTECGDWIIAYADDLACVNKGNTM